MTEHASLVVSVTALVFGLVAFVLAIWTLLTRHESFFQVASQEPPTTPDAVATILEGGTDGDSSTRVGESAAPASSPGAALAEGDR